MVSLPGHGETISGFTVTELGFIHMLGAKTAEFYHQASGARLLYIQNDDPELGFNLIYRTPQTDETDTNHIPVSYTHLDVYKRQIQDPDTLQCFFTHYAFLLNGIF